MKPDELGSFHARLRAKGKGAKAWANSWTEVEYLGGGKFAATIGVGHRVFKDKVDGKWKKRKVKDNRPDHVLVQSAKCCVEVYPFYAKYFDVNHEEVRLYEERWVVQRLFRVPDRWRDVDAYNPVMTVEETENGITVSVSYTTDYGSLVVKYVQRDGCALKHEVTFTNTSGSTETFRVLQRWAGIVGAKCNGKDVPIVEDASFFAFHGSDKPESEFNIAENVWRMVYTGKIDPVTRDPIEKTDQCLQRPVTIETHAQGMKADFVYARWVLADGESLVVDPATTTISPPNKDAHVNRGYPDRNYNLTYLIVNRGPTYDHRTLIEWDISSIPSGSTIDLAQTRLDCYYSESPDYTFEFRRIIGSWTETKVTWNNQPAITDVNGVDTACPPTTGWYVVTVTAQVSDARSAGTTYGVRLKCSAEGAGAENWNFRSKEYDGSDPELYIEYTPPIEPPTVTTQDATGIGFD